MHSITIPIAELRPALAGLGKIIPRRSTLPVLSHLRVERTAKGHVELAGTDLDATAIIRLETPSDGDPSVFLVPYPDLNNVTKRCGRADTVELIATQKDRVSIRFPAGSQFVEHRCQTAPTDDFPPIPEITGPPVTLQEDARRAIREAFACASTDPTRLILNGAFIDVARPKAHYIVATDGRHLFSSNSFTFPLTESLVIPSHRFLAWRDFNQDGDWCLRVTPVQDAGAKFQIASAHWRFLGSAIMGNFPEWRQVIPSAASFRTRLEFEPAALLATLQTLERMPDHDPVHHAIGIEARDGTVQLLGKSAADEPWNRIALPGVRATGTDLIAHLNRHFLAKALRFGLTRVELNDALSPLRFSEGGRQMIVMPTRSEPAPSQNTPPGASAPAAQNHNPSPVAEQPQETTDMPTTQGTTTPAHRNGHDGSVHGRPEQPSFTAALERLETIKGSYREAIRGLNELGDLLKQTARDQKASEKEISSVRQTLRSLQSVRI